MKKSGTIIRPAFFYKNSFAIKKKYYICTLNF